MASMLLIPTSTFSGNRSAAFERRSENARTWWILPGDQVDASPAALEPLEQVEAWGIVTSFLVGL